MTSGIHSLSAEQYFAADGLSRSMLDTLITESPLHFHAAHIAGTTEEEETGPMSLGTWAHRFLLEPESLDGAYHEGPASLFIDEARLKKLTSAVRIGDAITEDGKVEVEWNGAFAEAKAWTDAHRDKPIISARQAKQLRNIRDAVWNHAGASQFLRGAKTEQCLFAEDSRGTLRKARLDLIPAGGNTLADLKTCASADYDEITKAVEKRGYYRQAAFTLELCKRLGLPFVHWVIICVESSPPHDVVVYPIDELAIRVGRNEIEGAIQTYRNCMEIGKWPGRCPDIADAISLPAWRQRELDAA